MQLSRTLYLGFVGIILLCGMAPSQAAAQGYEIKRYTIHIEVHPRYFDVKEELDVNFKVPKHGIYRVIPLKYRLNDAITNKTFLDPLLGYRIYISRVKVPGYRDDESRANGMLKIRIGDEDKTISGLHHYTISYRVKNAYLAYTDRSVFYWNLVGNKWDVPIDSLSYTLSLYRPLALSSSDYDVFTGALGDTSHGATLAYTNGQFTGAAATSLQPGEGLTVQIVLPKDYVQPFSTGRRIWHWTGWFLFPLVMIAVFIIVWMKIGKDRKFTEVVNYMPPKDMDPAMSGFLLSDQSLHTHLIALLPYWAAKGLLNMRYTPKKNFLKDDEWTFIKKGDLGTAVPAYQQIFFDGIFSSGDEVKLSSLKDSFYKTMKDAKKRLNKNALEEGFYTPVSVRTFHYSQILLGVVGFSGVIFLFSIQQPFPAIFTILVTLVLMVLNHLLLKRTKKGDEAFRKVRGFRRFVEKAEKNKLQTLLHDDPTYFEKTLGYAVAFGMLEKWADRFDGLLQQPPTWYYGDFGSGFRMNRFASQFSRGIGAMQTVMVSSSSGSGAGGSSGGGFGGGGGGSW